MPIPETNHISVDLDETARQLGQAAHDAQVAYEYISFGYLDWAHTNAITARAKAETAENVLRAALSASKDGDGDRQRMGDPGQAGRYGRRTAAESRHGGPAKHHPGVTERD